jgi:Skp family chaperone for outer membrane proteins
MSLNKSIKLAVLGIAILFSLQAMALETKVTAVQSQLAVVDVKKAYEGSTMIKKLNEVIEKQKKNLQKEFDIIEEDSKKKLKALEAKKATISQEEFEKTSQEIAKDFKDNQQRFDEAKAKIDLKFTTAMKAVREVLVDAVKEEASKTDIEFVMQTDQLFYVKNGLRDLTAVIRTDLDKMLEEQQQAIDDFNYDKIFSRIYANNIWKFGSGTGSLPENTIKYRELLQKYFNDPKYKTIVDFGSGDWQVMSLIKIPPNKTYIGVDTVDEVLAETAKKYAKTNVHFVKFNNFSYVPRGDLLIVKDVFMHWPNEKIIEFSNEVLPHYRYALLTHSALPASLSANQIDYDTHLGGFRAVDISKAPFNFKNITKVMEYDALDDKQYVVQVYFYDRGY